MNIHNLNVDSDREKARSHQPSSRLTLEGGENLLRPGCHKLASLGHFQLFGLKQYF